MNIDWIHFSPLTALFGGVLLGLSASLLILLNGKVAGISGIFANLLFAPFEKSSGKSIDRYKNKLWRLFFIFGLVISPSVYKIFMPIPEINFTSNTFILVIAGLLVGFGSNLGSGCTSGHGICGLSRLSKRSIVATLTFMSFAFMTAFIMRHLI